MSAAKNAPTLLSRFKALWDHPLGPRTTHFWGPVANWGFVVAGMIDSQKPPDKISPNMTATLCVYSMLFMRFSWVVIPRNYLLLACHASNETIQLWQLGRWYDWHLKGEPPCVDVDSGSAAVSLDTKGT